MSLSIFSPDRKTAVLPDDKAAEEHNYEIEKRQGILALVASGLLTVGFALIGSIFNLESERCWIKGQVYKKQKFDALFDYNHMKYTNDGKIVPIESEDTAETTTEAEA